MVNIYTDASIRFANKRGCGYAYVIEINGVTVSRKFSIELRNINKLELMAIIDALRVITTNAQINIYTDSQFVISRRNKPKHKCEELWKEFEEYEKTHSIKLIQIFPVDKNSLPLHIQAHHLAREASDDQIIH